MAGALGSRMQELLAEGQRLLNDDQSSMALHVFIEVRSAQKQQVGSDWQPGLTDLVFC
jgi:hypothetical protein